MVRRALGEGEEKAEKCEQMDKWIKGFGLGIWEEVKLILPGRKSLEDGLPGISRPAKKEKINKFIARLGLPSDDKHYRIIFLYRPPSGMYGPVLMAVELGTFFANNGAITDSLMIFLKLDGIPSPPKVAQFRLGQISLLKADKRFEGWIDWPEEAQDLKSPGSYLTEYLLAGKSCRLLELRSVLQQVVGSYQPSEHREWVQEALSNCRDRMRLDAWSQQVFLADVSLLLQELGLASEALELLGRAIDRGVLASSDVERINAGNIHFMRSFIRASSINQIEVTREVLEHSLADLEKALDFFSEAKPGPGFLQQRYALLSAMEVAVLLGDLDKTNLFSGQLRSLPPFQLRFEARGVDRPEADSRELYVARERYGLAVVNSSLRILGRIINSEHRIVDLQQNQYDVFLVGLEDARNLRQFPLNYWIWDTVIQEIHETHQACLAGHPPEECLRFQTASRFAIAVDCIFGGSEGCLENIVPNT